MLAAAGVRCLDCADISQRNRHERVGDDPLYVAVLRQTDEAMARWRGARTMALSLTALFTLAVLGGSVLLGLGVRRLEASNAALRASEARGHASNQAKTERLAAISHELRTPLANIRGLTELMEKRLREARFRDQAGMICKAAEYLNALLTQILDLVKLESGAMQATPSPVQLAPVLDGAVAFFAVTAAEKGLKLQLDVAPGVPETLSTDELRLEQSLNNLLSNALKFTTEGSVTLLVGPQDGRLLITVADTGPGIPAHLHETVFERFRQADASVSYQHGGTGWAWR